jgi:MFS family permease
MPIPSPRQFFLGDGTQVSRPIVWIIGFFAFLNVYSVQAVLPMVMEDFHATALQAGLTVGATVLAIGLVSPFMGMLSDALGRRPILCSSLFALTIPTALIPLALDLNLLIALRFLQGLAVPGITGAGAQSRKFAVAAWWRRAATMWAAR